MPVLAPVAGQIVDVTDVYPDNPPGTNGDHANHLLMDIGGGRYVSMAHLKQGSVTVRSARSCGGVSRLPRSGTADIRTNPTCTCRYRTPPGRRGRRPDLPDGVHRRPIIRGGPGRGPTPAHPAPATLSEPSGPDGCWEPPGVAVSVAEPGWRWSGVSHIRRALVQQRCQGVPQHRRPGEAPRRGVSVSTNGLVATASLLGVEGWCG